MRHLLILALLTASSLPAQVIRRGIFPPVLQTFLELTNDQVTKLEETNDRFRQYEASRGARRFELQFEISAETAKPTIDPMALGLRHREVELIRREVEAERTKTRAEVQAILTAPQRTKLATLDQALRLQNTACEAVGQNLLVEPLQEFSFASLLLGFNLPGLCGTQTIGGIFSPGNLRPFP